MCVKTYKINSLEELNEFALDFANCVKIGDTVFLNGNMGVGKTTFTSFLAKALGINENVVSPTYTISREYLSGKITLLHIDLYRLLENNNKTTHSDTQTKQIIMQLDNSFYNDALKTGIVVIEWGESIIHTIKPRWEINIKFDNLKNSETRTVETQYFAN